MATAQDVIDEFRRRAMDTVKPYLWSDDEALVYLNKAYGDFIRDIGGIRDSQSALCTLTVAADQEIVPLDPRIIKVVSAKTVTQYRDIPVVGPRHATARARTASGQLSAFIAGEDDGTLRCTLVPTEETTVRLVIDRLPLEYVDEDATLEVRAEHVYDLVPGMMALAYTKQDTETRDEKRAEKFQAAFAALCRKAYLEKRRRAGNHRSVAYGGL